MKPVIQKPYHGSIGSKLNTGPGKTEQSHKKQCDMNYILRDYHKTGLVKHANKHQGTYDDVPAVDFQTAMFIVKQAQDQFNELPADQRKRFGNDPAGFLEFVQNPENKAEMQKMGMLKGNDGFDGKGAPSGAPVEPAKVLENPGKKTSTEGDEK